MSTVLVDTNVILDVLTDDKNWAEWSVEALTIAESNHSLIINPIVYSELAVGFSSHHELDQTLETLNFGWEEITKPALYRAAQAFRQYKKTGGTKTSPLPDFYIGAHAETQSHTLLTQDSRRYKTYFPTVPLIAP